MREIRNFSGQHRLSKTPRSDESLSVTRVVNALLRSDELYCPFDQSSVAVAGAANAVNKRQSEAVTVFLFFLPLTPMLQNPAIPFQGCFILSPFSLSSRVQDSGPSNLTIDIYNLTEN